MALIDDDDDDDIFVWGPFTGAPPYAFIVILRDQERRSPMSSILADVKAFCQVPEWDDGFDNVLLIHINAALLTVFQIGIGPPGGLIVSSKDELWSSLVEGSFEYEAVKSFVCLKVKMVFDPPSSATVAEAYNASIAELEWRLREQAEGVFY